jgi:hypothetical protein
MNLAKTFWRFPPILLCLFGLLLSGCATDKRPSKTLPGFTDLSCPSDKSLVYLYRVRPWFGQGKSLLMCVNYLPTVSLSGHEYCPLVLNPGLTQFGHQYRESVITPNITNPADIKNRIDLRVHLEAGRTYFIAYRFWINPFRHPNPTMVLVDRDTGIKEMSTCSTKKSLSDSHEN